MKQIFISSIFVFAVALIGCKKSEDGKVEVVPLAPTELKATLFSKDQIDLSWKDNSTNETGYKIERKTDSGVFTEIGSSNTYITTYSDKTVSLNTNYTYRVYSFNQVGKSINYSNEVSIKTLNIPTLTDNSTNIMLDATQWAGNSSLSFSVFGQISSDGGSPLISKGIVWGTSSNPTIDLSTKTIVVDFHTPNSFTGRVSGLALGTKYYIRTYASNIAGTAYGPEKQFTTDNIPVITTNDITITSAGAKSGGNISSDGRGSGTLAWTNITSRGVVWGTSINPTIALSTKTSDGTGTGSFQSTISGLALGTKYYLRSYATNSMGTGYGNEISITPINGPAITTTSLTDLTSNGAKSGGTINSDGGSPILARGVVWGTSTNPTIALSTKTINGTGTGSFQSVITLLDGIRTYYVRAYATNSAGTAYGNEISFSNNVSISFNYKNVTSLTGRIWLDRNLGAIQVATSSTDAEAYGDLYQWGRGSDGHQLRNSGTTKTQSSSNVPGNSLFIAQPTSTPFDWRNPQNDNLWQGVNGINNPCPTGYRIPTIAEWTEEIKTWSSNNAAGAYASPLKLPMAGRRGDSNSNPVIELAGFLGMYWSSTVSREYAEMINFRSDRNSALVGGRVAGSSCRCIKD